MESLSNNANRRKILIIDDEVDLCLLMRAYFLRKNYGVTISHTFRDALNRLGEEVPDIVMISEELCGNRKATIEKILEAAPGVKVISIGNNVIYGDPKSL